MVEKKSILLTCQFYEPKVFVELDEGKFNQIVNNLLFNAIKFTHAEGWIKISVETKLENGLNIMHVSIQDNGIGIPSNFKSEIFSKKASLHRTGTQGEEGTGLGLSITKKLMFDLNGKIEIESEENQGTTVHLYFYKY